MYRAGDGVRAVKPEAEILQVINFHLAAKPLSHREEDAIARPKQFKRVAVISRISQEIIRFSGAGVPIQQVDLARRRRINDTFATFDIH